MLHVPLCLYSSRRHPHARIQDPHNPTALLHHAHHRCAIHEPSCPTQVFSLQWQVNRVSQIHRCHIETWRRRTTMPPGKAELYEHYYCRNSRQFVDNISNAYFLQKVCAFWFKVLWNASVPKYSINNELLSFGSGAMGSHYLNQFWFRYVTLHGVTKPNCVEQSISRGLESVYIKFCFYSLFILGMIYGIGLFRFSLLSSVIMTVYIYCDPCFFLWCIQLLAEIFITNVLT